MKLSKTENDGTCSWCSKRREVVHVTFEDNSSTVLCWNDLKRMAKSGCRTVIRPCSRARRSDKNQWPRMAFSSFGDRTVKLYKLRECAAILNCSLSNCYALVASGSSRAQRRVERAFA